MSKTFGERVEELKARGFTNAEERKWTLDRSETANWCNDPKTKYLEMKTIEARARQEVGEEGVLHVTVFDCTGDRVYEIILVDGEASREFISGGYPHP